MYGGKKNKLRNGGYRSSAPFTWVLAHSHAWGHLSQGLYPALSLWEPSAIPLFLSEGKGDIHCKEQRDRGQQGCEQGRVLSTAGTVTGTSTEPEEAGGESWALCAEMLEKQDKKSVLCLPRLGSLESGSWQQRRTMNTWSVLTADLLHFAASKNPSRIFPSLVSSWAASYRLCFASPEPKYTWSLKKIKKWKRTSNHIFLKTEKVKKQMHKYNSTQQVHFCKQVPWSSTSSPEGQECYSSSDIYRPSTSADWQDETIPHPPISFTIHGIITTPS